ncbi:MAG: rhodanese-like domain-containing protein [Desulfobulbaceae bacterium]|nr:rhodanese-like domain-containing protein [Desulfobulbaceae bacterium]
MKVVELEELKAGYDNGTFMIVDVRSTLEYEVIKIKGAYHVDLAKPGFIQKLQALAAQYPARKIAVYCNGVTCLKSYKSAMDAAEAGMDNVYAFDVGIPAWSAAYPSETLLLGKEVTDPQKQLISRSELEKVMLSFETFQQKAAENNAMVIDARDPIQRTHKLPGFEKALPIPLDKLIKNVINKGNLKDKQLMIFDQVGKQVQWLMYYLVDQGYSNFYFLEGGATSVLKEQEYR